MTTTTITIAIITCTLTFFYLIWKNEHNRKKMKINNQDLVKKSARRNKGEFFTPTPFVDLAHKYISETFGEDWKEKFVVWDNSAGTLNLTRDYKFKELYCSTLEQSDIDTANQMGYNMEATKFQFDFLNDGDELLPQGLREAIESGKEILFLINPPYATAANGGNKKDNTKKDVSFTSIREEMYLDGYGDSVRQLYTQFLFRVQKLNNINNNIKIGIFSPPLFLSGSFFQKFRELFLKDFNYKVGYLFEALHFSDVAKGWGISFTIFESGINQNKEYNLDIIDYNELFELEVINEKTIYNCDNNESALDNCKKELRGLKTIETIQIKNGLSVGGSNKVSVVENIVGYFDCASNNVYQNNQRVGLYSTAFSNRGGLSIIPENFHKVTNLFTARKSIQPTWINCKDEYLAPNEQHPQYEQFTHDSIIYSLFNNSSQQSSLRQVDYKDKKWDIKNEFFWLSKNEMLKLAEEHHYDELYKDARTSDDRFVYNKLFTEGIYDKLSPDAREVLNVATDLVKKSFEMRKLISENHPEYHLDSWDAGYAQLKLVWKDYFKDEFKVFRDKYKQLEDRMRLLVYELGFLRK